MNVLMMTNEQILKLGFEALVDKLGPVGMIRFIHQFEAGTGNYTEERQQWVGVSDVETLAQQIQQAEDNTEHVVNTLGFIIEQNPDDVDVYDPFTRGWADLQELGRIESDLTAGNIEKSSAPPFRIESQIWTFATPASS